MHFNGVSQLDTSKRQAAPVWLMTALAASLLLFATITSAQNLALPTIQNPTFESDSVVLPDALRESVSQLSGDDLGENFSKSSNDQLFNPYQSEQLDLLLRQALASQESGDHQLALSLFEQAWQISRISHGLYHESQVDLIDLMVYSAIELGSWDVVDTNYDYLSHLYRRLYDIDDPRLETGLQKISSFHVNAFNLNIDGKREYHLRKAAQIFDIRLQVATLTLSEGHPKFGFLQESLAISRHQLYLMSQQHKEMLTRHRQSRRDQVLAGLD